MTRLPCLPIGFCRRNFSQLLIGEKTAHANQWRGEIFLIRHWIPKTFGLVIIKQKNIVVSPAAGAQCQH